VGELHLLLRRHCPPGLEVLLAPFDVTLTANTIVQPDLLVTRRSDLTHKDLPKAPLLALEVLSPSTRHIDLGLKRARYETAGSPSYWVFDPGEPAMTIWELEHGRYVERAHVTGDEEHMVAAPYPMTIRPTELLG
jgi:Uma2 family endonuclease